MKLLNKKIIGIYQVTNKINGKIYIGKSFDIYVRWKKHISSLDKFREKGLAFHRAIIKYGENNFEWKIILQIENKDDHLLNVMERFFIQEFHTQTNDPLGPGYNETPGGEGHSGKRSEEFCQRLRNQWIERRKIPVSDETRKKLSDAHRGKKYDVSSGKMSEASKNRWINSNIRAKTIATRKTNVIKNRGMGIRVSYPTIEGIEEHYFSSVKEAAKYYGLSPDGFNNILEGKIKKASSMSTFLQDATIQWISADTVLANRSDLTTI